MKKINIDGGLTIYSWCPDVEEQALDLMKDLVRKPYVKHAALMPDAHFGMAAPIGSVLACDNVVIPWAVGSDCGCGMGAVRTSIHKGEIDHSAKARLLHSFSRSVPVGFSHNTQKRMNELKNKYEDKVRFIIEKTKILEKYEDYNPVGNIDKEFYAQLGTLGGGNHFIEVQYDESGYVWIMVHSGSRNIGKRLGDYFNALAEDLNAKWYSQGREVPYLPTDTVEGKAYLAYMDFALRFAFLNRQVMLFEIQECIKHEFPSVKWTTKDIKESDGDLINIHHNDAQLENHMGRNYWVHRKGATRAFKGQLGIIPGSMGTPSYIVVGKGERMSLMSCSHGAGRKMGRREFCRRMKNSLDQIEESLSGVVHSEFGKIQHGKDKGMLDVSEAPAAYKDINLVMEQQKDLVEPIVKLHPIVCLKG